MTADAVGFPITKSVNMRVHVCLFAALHSDAFMCLIARHVPAKRTTTGIDHLAGSKARHGIGTPQFVVGPDDCIGDEHRYAPAWPAAASSWHYIILS